jgi:hypothetical protein
MTTITNPPTSWLNLLGLFPVNVRRFKRLEKSVLASANQLLWIKIIQWAKNKYQTHLVVGINFMLYIQVNKPLLLECHTDDQEIGSGRIPPANYVKNNKWIFHARRILSGNGL